jgi:uncharacterized RDD family membrane protein YckC
MGSMPPTGYQPYPAYQQPAMPQYAGFLSRLGSRLIDGLVTAAISLPFAIAGWLMLRVALEDCYSIDQLDGTTTIECPDGVNAPFLAGAIGLFVAGAVVGLIMLVRWQGKGQTPGMKAVGNRLLDAQTGQPIGSGRAFGRNLAQILSAAACYLGFLWMLWDPKKQTWHDKLVNSVVVKA